MAKAWEEDKGTFGTYRSTFGVHTWPLPRVHIQVWLCYGGFLLPVEFAGKQSRRHCGLHTIPEPQSPWLKMGIKATSQHYEDQNHRGAFQRSHARHRTSKRILPSLPLSSHGHCHGWCLESAGSSVAAEHLGRERQASFEWSRLILSPMFIATL
jgi:hypothetical protein